MIANVSAWIAGSLVTFLICCGAALALYAVMAVANWKLFEKAGVAGWKSIIPLYNKYNVFRIAWKKSYFWLWLGIWIVSLICVLSHPVIAAIFFAITYVVLHVLLNFNLGKSFGQQGGFIAGLILLTPIFKLILAFGGAQYHPEWQESLIRKDKEKLLANTKKRALRATGFSPKESVLTFVPGSYLFDTMRSRNARTGVLFILPFILGFLVFMLRPLGNSFLMSFNDVSTGADGMIWNFVGFNNYKHAFGVDPYFNQRLVEEIPRMAINAVATLVLSFVIAVILNQNFKGRTAARAIFFLPVILSSGVLPGIEQQNEFYNMMQGISDAVANSSGVNLSASLQSLLSVSGVASGVFDVLFQMIDAIYDIVMASGIQIIVMLSGLQTISPSLYEAADVEGCTAWEAFWKITFPMVSPLLLVNAIYTIIDFFMKNDNKVMERINELTQRLEYGHVAAMNWIYFGVAILFIAISTLIISRGVHHYED